MAPRTLRLLHSRGGQGTGSLQSWHINDYEVRSDDAKPSHLFNHTLGPLPLFPRLDVMPSSATAMNDAELPSSLKSYVAKAGQSIASQDIEFELAHSTLMGFKTKAGGDDGAFSTIHEFPLDFTLLNRNVDQVLSTDAIDHAVAENRFGWHAVDPNTLDVQKRLNFKHNMGDQLEGRDAGLERGWNEAVPGENPIALPADTPARHGVQNPDEIEINNSVVNVADTLVQGVPS